MLVTVAICTWNRAKLLERTLAEMEKLHIPAGVRWELLVVNNNCTDDTDAVLARYQGKLPLRPLVEAQQGLCWARNCAIREARGDLLLWTDDDVLVHPEWLTQHVRASRDWPSASFFGGTIDPWFSVPPPRWVRRHLDRLFGPYAIRQLGEEVRPFTGDETPFGANMAFRMNVAKAHLFDVRLGHIGKTPIGGDETDLLARLERLGHTGVWVGTAKVQHWIPPERLTLRYVWNWFVGKGRMYQRQGTVAVGKLLLGAPAWVRVKYLKGRLKLPWLAPFKGPRWFGIFRDTAVCKGIIEEFLESRRSSAAESAARPQSLSTEVLP